LTTDVGTNYQGGMLDSSARITIQFVHRLGAFITASYVICLSILMIWKGKNKRLQGIAYAAIMLICLQVFLGIINVIYLLPLAIAVAHNGVAALLMATMLRMFCLTKGGLKHVN
jgi:cytochrome c oxidase assembly protein subunit 15